MSMVAFIWTSVPFLVALASFATYVFIDENNTLDATKTFVTMSYLVNMHNFFHLYIWAARIYHYHATSLSHKRN